MIKVKKRQVQRFLSIRKRNQLHFEQKHSNLLALKQKHPLHIDTDSLKEKSDGTVKHKGKKVAFSRKMSDRLNKLKTHKKTSQLAAEKAAIKKDEDVQETYAEMTLPDSVINPSIQGIPPLDIEPSTQLPLRVFVYASLAMSCLCLISILFYALFFCRIKKRLSMARKQAGKRLTGTLIQG